MLGVVKLPDTQIQEKGILYNISNPLFSYEFPDATFATQPQSLATSEARIIKLHDTSVQDESTKTTERDEDEILIDPSAADSICKSFTSTMYLLHL